MTVSSVNITRVSENLKSQTIIQRLRQTNLDLFRAQQQLITGKRFSAPSEAPGDAAVAMRLSSLVEQQDQIIQNVTFADNFLAQTDVTLGDTNALLREAQSIASDRLNTSGNPLDATQQAEWESGAMLVDSIIDQLVRLGNSQFQGTYIFGGQRTTTEPFAQELGGVVYNGNTIELATRVDLLREGTYSVTGADVFGALSSEVRAWQDLSPGLTASTRLTDLNGAAGKGVRLGSVRIVDSALAGSVVVDLTGSDNVGDIVDRINTELAAAGSAATVAVGDNGIDLNVPAGQSIEILDEGNGKTALDLGLDGTYAAPAAPPAQTTFNGDDLDARVTLTTAIASLYDAAGTVLGSISIANGQLNEVIDLSGAQTVEDVLNTINDAGVGVVASINEAGTGINVVNRLSGQGLRIADVGGGATARTLGIASFHEDVPLSDLNRGMGVETIEGKDDLRITFGDPAAPTEFTVDLSGTATIGDVIQAINAAASAAGIPAGTFLADLHNDGNGIRLTASMAPGQSLTVSRENLSAAADGLGLADLQATADASGQAVLVGEDVHNVFADGVFGTLSWLSDALRDGSRRDVIAATEQLETLITDMARAQGMVGAQSKAMNDRLHALEDSRDATKVMLGNVQDIDITEAVTQFQQVQTALQANIQSSAMMFELSLLDFLS